ncbi:Type-1 restriction enzyme R protein [Thalassovita gelatinovora]|uniref:Type I restriction enzyme endonuclease subunit n=1 Tax=Thalassovita gelatinovora TaxID=53501 RepID=A0A0P1FVG9_THAGE|nr:type I restriction endonuclease subunit R [Thalassovita gelatinovora]QIZ80030.1 type I restriction endonuclease subunit R [Thalassovita gelatinovora]CUH65734.1 Type-1 restriction enzyme R protein [Thalassovita gelatinovora]SER04236.1 type I restriction enzyme, R subunit [Thalassovita gelatinovora]
MADYQSEAQLEADLVTRLTGLGYAPVTLPDMAAMQANLRAQLGRHNGVTLSDAEFAKVLNHLDKGNVFEKAKTLRGRMQLTRDDGTPLYLQFLNTQEWCQNQYQVTTQVTVTGHHKNRFDVTLLINGLPLVQIELKRRGVELKEAFNQINRYQRHSYWAESALFQYVQLFVISNGVNTKYYANNRNQDFKQTFFWAEEDNTLVTQLDAFADVFLEKCHVSKMISKYIVLHESDKILMVLRPYQYYAVEAIDARVKAGRKNGYIWHTTGSGKTLTSFKAAQVLIENPKVDKVVFVVDRADLDYQTTKEFNHFSDGSVDGTDNTRALVGQLGGDTKLIVTTIQKLNTAISRDRYEGALQAVKDQRVVFIFDECHRSQFGDTHKRIVRFFSKAQMFGFTGTPIFADNAVGKRTTKDLFAECLHKYVITDAIADENVLRFSVEYWGRLKRKDGSLMDEEVPAINVKEFFDNPDRIDGVVDWIIQNHDRKTHNKQFSAMLCVSSVDALIAYYEAFRRKKEAGEHHLRVATIFTYGPNEADPDADGLIGDPDLNVTDLPVDVRKRDRLESFVADYNAMYQTKETVKDSVGFYTYYNHLSQRLKNRDRKDALDKDRLDILLVVNMFLTGFDAKKLNTLYVDKNLKYHGLIQAFSRTNRILGQVKSQGNIVCFRNLKPNTDQAITLFSNKDAIETILMAPYGDYLSRFNEAVEVLRGIAPDPDSVNELNSEDDQLTFVQAFRDLIRLRNVLTSFTEYNADDLNLEPQAFEDYKSKYLDIHDKTKVDKPDDPASIIDEVDFELELIQRDEINVAYILGLLSEAFSEQDSLDPKTRDASKAKKKMVYDLLGSERHLRSKRELIEKFIEQHMSVMTPDQSVAEVFNGFWDEEKSNAIAQICAAENIEPSAFKQMIEQYHFTGKKPLQGAIVDALTEKPKILERKGIVERVTRKLQRLISTFDDGIGSL